jgi:hypothetical protein
VKYKFDSQHVGMDDNCALPNEQARKANSIDDIFGHPMLQNPLGDGIYLACVNDVLFKTFSKVCEFSLIKRLGFRHGVVSR